MPTEMQDPTAKTALIIGASSGIGEALARVLDQSGYRLALAARRTERLQALQQTLKQPSKIGTVDLTRAAQAMERLTDLIKSTGKVDLAVITAGVALFNRELDWEMERQTVAVNVEGFVAAANTLFLCFCQQGRGHLAAVSSVAAIRGSGRAPAYNASKAFVSNYLEGLRLKARMMHLPIFVTDIRPGFVATAMLHGAGLPWVATPETAAGQIYRAIARNRKTAYITESGPGGAVHPVWLKPCLLSNGVQKGVARLFENLRPPEKTAHRKRITDGLGAGGRALLGFSSAELLSVGMSQPIIALTKNFVDACRTDTAHFEVSLHEGKDTVIGKSPEERGE
jgi:short-subunit dehydrogenase